jgi:hypothetical protein
MLLPPSVSCIEAMRTRQKASTAQKVEAQDMSLQHARLQLQSLSASKISSRIGQTESLQLSKCFVHSSVLLKFFY